MSMLESIEELRDWATRPDGSFWCPEISEFSDAIEHEVSDRYIERDKAIEAPLDADGVVWAYDNGWFSDKYGVRHEMGGMRIDCHGEWMLRSPIGWYRANECRHVKQYAVEDVLREFAKSGTPTGEGGVLFETALIEKYADKLRDLLGGDAL